MPSNHKVKFRWKAPLKVHCTIPEKNTGQVTLLLKLPLNNEILLEKAAENPWDNATENPR